MTPPLPATPPPPDSDLPEDEGTGIPVCPTWRGLYTFVLVTFVVYVVMLIALTRAYAP